MGNSHAKKNKKSKAKETAAAPAAAAGAAASSSADFKVVRRVFMATNTNNIREDWSFAEKDVLGRGAFGTVYRAKSKKDHNVIRAVKEIAKRKLDAAEAESLKNEIETLCSLDHPNIIKLFSTYEDDHHLYLVMELLTGGELFDDIINKQYYGEEDAAFAFRQMVSGIMYCHQHNIAHRDLKPENFILESKEPGCNIKIIDFGLSQRSDKMMKSTVGSPGYWAPQVIQGHYDKSCDMWSLGVILYILLCGYPPWALDRSADPFILRGEFAMEGYQWDYVSQEAKDLVRGLLEVNPSRRLTAEQAFQHEWVQSMTRQKSSRPLNQNTLSNLRNFRKNQQLKKAVLTVMASNLTGSEIKSLREAFVSLDKNGDGTLTVVELREGIASVAGSNAQVQEELQRIMEGLDTDGSGQIDYTEFIAATMDHHVYLQEEKLLATFKMFDKDGSGRISAQELRQVLSDGNPNIDMSVFSEMIREADLDGDGEIDYNEFFTMMANNGKM